MEKSPFLAKRFFFGNFFSEKMCGCACGCGREKWGASACAAHYENVCDVRAGADENRRTLKVMLSPVFHKTFLRISCVKCLIG